MTSNREVLLVLHPHRPEAQVVAQEIVSVLSQEGITFLTITPTEIEGLAAISREELSAHLPRIELALVLGGDGTILRGAEQVHGTNIPVLGINLGHVGFLAQIGRPSTSTIIDAIRNKKYTTEIVAQQMLLLGPKQEQSRDLAQEIFSHGEEDPF